MKNLDINWCPLFYDTTSATFVSHTEILSSFLLCFQIMQLLTNPIKSRWWPWVGGMENMMFKSVHIFPPSCRLTVAVPWAATTRLSTSQPKHPEHFEQGTVDRSTNCGYNVFCVFQRAGTPRLAKPLRRSSTKSSHRKRQKVNKTRIQRLVCGTFFNALFQASFILYYQVTKANFSCTDSNILVSSDNAAR